MAFDVFLTDYNITVTQNENSSISRSISQEFAGECHFFINYCCNNIGLQKYLTFVKKKKKKKNKAVKKIDVFSSNNR